MPYSNKIIITKLVYLSFYFALILLLSFTNIGLIQIGPIAINLVTFILIISAAHLGFWGSFFGGIMLGMASFLSALAFGRILFSYPDIAILPRLILGVLVFIYVKIAETLVFKKFRKNSNLFRFWIKTLVFVFVGILTAATNTFLVTVVIFIHKALFRLDAIGSIEFWLALIWVNALLELIFLGLLSGVFATFLIRIAKNKRKNWYFNNRW
ncbi:hypothetical protein [Mycoplasmopsis sturni]|uniref:hypothetical protein n=1 Tax=Mycoplasmopsis sturni TaxID=39047 RepID=UPI00068B5EC2|nr:hypothetical protein [Mycoplasmopsis sturni]